MVMADDQATVLVVEDETATADAFEAVLKSDYDVRTAYTGEEALRKLTEAVDVVLLDRRLPDISGDDVLDHIQADNINCRIAMVTAVDPDFDIIGMGVDDYLVKPVGPETLSETVERLAELYEYDEIYLEYSSKLVKRNVLEVEKTQSELEENDRFNELQAEIEELEAQLEAMEDEFDDRFLKH
jgi:DNA-binding response OmpR family regulator